jgi:hypothetical protein
LTRLGYLPPMSFLPPAVLADDWRLDHLTLLQANYQPALRAVNEALLASQL